MQDALSTQLTREFFSAHLYLSMSAYCSHAGYNGSARWLEVQYEEEHQHATKIFNYLIDQGVKVGLGGIDRPPSEFGSLQEVFEASLAHEQEQTGRLNDLSNQALTEKDHATYNLLQWFVNEQVEEEATVGDIIAKLRMVGDDGYGLLMIDNELGARAPISAVGTEP